MLIYQTPSIAPASPLDVAPGAAAIYEGLTNQKIVLQAQLEELTSQRSDLVTEIGNATENGVTGPGRTGLEERIATLDKRIAGTDQQIALVDAQVAKAAAVPGAVVPHPEPVRSGPPDEAFVLGGLFMIIVLLPLSIAFARRIWRRTPIAAAQPLSAELMSRIQHIEHAIETSGLEIERIGEGQRFITKLFSEKLPALRLQAESGGSSEKGA